MPRSWSQVILDSAMVTVNTIHHRNLGWVGEGESQVVTRGSSALTIQGWRVAGTHSCVPLARCRS